MVGEVSVAQLDEYHGDIKGGWKVLANLIFSKYMFDFWTKDFNWKKRKQPTTPQITTRRQENGAPTDNHRAMAADQQARDLCTELNNFTAKLIIDVK